MGAILSSVPGGCPPWQHQRVASKASEKEIDSLYEGSLDDFTKQRNALAKRFRDGGDGEAAGRVKALRKPSLPAWAINQGIRADQSAARRLLAAGAALRDASGGDELRTAMREEAEAVEEMTAAAQAASTETLSAGMVDRVRDTLRAVAGDDELRGEFEAGRVERDRKAVGFGAGMTPAGSAARGGAKRGPSAADRRKAEAAVRRARKALDARRRDLAAAQERADAARRALDDAEGSLARARGDVDAAQDELEAAESARDEL
jgi:hypothetical protein